MICEVNEKISPSLGRVEGEERAFGEGLFSCVENRNSIQTALPLSGPESATLPEGEYVRASASCSTAANSLYCQKPATKIPEEPGKCEFCCHCFAASRHSRLFASIRPSPLAHHHFFLRVIRNSLFYIRHSSPSSHSSLPLYGNIVKAVLSQQVFRVPLAPTSPRITRWAGS
jgi:hypothetical protein